MSSSRKRISSASSADGMLSSADSHRVAELMREEAVEQEPSLVDLIARPGQSCWIVDPLDGTANFAAGKDRFAMIVCLVQDRSAVAGWILDVPRGRMGVVHKGQGVAVDGAPVHGRPPDRPL